jgi:hypothetical protein
MGKAVALVLHTRTHIGNSSATTRPRMHRTAHFHRKNARPADCEETAKVL